ncbi:ladinin-1 [Pseudophryne corroboree]|uniref:ladinin-1 n=1 Tax=Pseudophryne corroboree TaxID=495146 RepID=UPI003081761E
MRTELLDMSISRGNWSNLSRVASQWIEDDEEEQIRERRRRNRDLSSTGNRVVEVLPEPDNSCSDSISSISSTEDRDVLTNRTHLDRQQECQSSKVHDKEENVATNQEEDKNKCTRNTVEENKRRDTERLEDQPPESTRDVAERLSKKNEVVLKHGSQINVIQKEEHTSKVNQISNSDQRKNILSKSQNENCQEPKRSQKWQMHENVRKPTEDSISWKKESHGSKIKEVQHQEISCQNNKDLKEQKLQTPESEVQDNPACSNNPSSSSIPVTAKPSDTDIVARSTSVTSPGPGNQLKFKSQVFVSSVKIPRRQSGSDSGVKSPPPLLEEPEEGAPPATRTVRTEVVIPSLSTTVSSTTQNSKQEHPPTPLQTSTSFKRFTPFTSSVRIQSEDRVDSGLIRSSSLRLSLRSKKIEDRMEKYNSAIKKSASVRVPSSHSPGNLGPSDGVASKRSIFEKEENSARSNISRKNIVSVDVASKRSLWQQRSQSSSDTKH